MTRLTLALAALAALASALMAPDPTVAQATARVDVPLSSLPPAHQSAVPAWARHGYVVRVDTHNRLWLYAPLDQSEIYVRPKSWSDLRYNPATGAVQVGEVATEPTSGDLPEGLDIPRGGVILPTDRSIGTFETNDPGFVPPVQPQQSGETRPEPTAGDTATSDHHAYHEPGQPCPGPGPCPLPQPGPNPPYPGPYPPQPSPGLDPTLLLLLIVGGAAVVAVILFNRRDPE